MSENSRKKGCKKWTKEGRKKQRKEGTETAGKKDVEMKEGIKAKKERKKEGEILPS